MKLLLKISILTLFCIPFTSVFAQISQPIDGVTIDTSTSNPRPGESIDIFVESFSFDLNASSIVWTVNGKTQAQGIGIKKITITAPQIGSKTVVSVNIKGSDGREIQKSTTIKTGSVDIIWETNGYVPPFFLGKLPFVYQNKVKLIAVPHLAKDSRSEIDPKTLVYSWKMGGKYIENGQGYGKQSIVVDSGGIPRDLSITVDISNRESTQNVSGSINLTPTEPTLSFYEEDSLYGILFNKSLTNKVPLKNSEMKVIGIPYGFNLTKTANTYTWSINNIEQPDLIDNRDITIRTKGDVDGSSDINLDIRNTESILQGARGGFTVYFSKKQSVANDVTF